MFEADGAVIFHDGSPSLRISVLNAIPFSTEITPLAAGAAAPSPATMLRLRACILARFLSSHSSTYPIPISPLHRLLSAAATDPSPEFAVERYLVDTCGLTGPQALKASAKLAHLKSPSKPDAVLAFLAGLGLSSANVAAAVAGDPQLLCADVDRTLAPVVAGLTAHGIPRAEVARLISLGRSISRCRSTVSNLPYYLTLLGSHENLLRLLKKNPDLLGCSLEKVVKPNVAFLRECGLDDCNISKLCLAAPRILGHKPEKVVKPNVAFLRECGLDDSSLAKLCLTTPRILGNKPERLRAMVTCAEGLGVPRGSPMFRHVLHAVSSVGEENITTKVDYLKKTFRWSDVEVGIVVCKSPGVLRRSEDMLQRLSEFLICEVGLEPEYIAHCPVMLTLSLESRLKPRYCTVKFLKENGLIKCFPSYRTIFKLTENVFTEMYIYPHKEAAPHLTEDYAAASKGETPTRFISA